MWYFAWMLGLPLAAILAVMNAIWLELREDDRIARAAEARERGRAPRGK